MNKIFMMFQMQAQTAQEKVYLRKINKYYFSLLLAHIPFCYGVAWYFGTSMIECTVLLALCLSVPWWVVTMNPDGRLASVVEAVASIGISGILIHLSKGMIEFHFHIFVALAWMIVFANPWALLIAAIVGACHHLTLFFVLPSSVFNYNASFGTVLLHATFVILETAINIWLAHRLLVLISSQGALLESAQLIRVASGEFSDQYESTAKSLSQQSDTLQETAATLVELNEMVAETSQNAQLASSFGQKANETVEGGKTTIKALDEKVGQLASSTKQVSENIHSSFSEIKSLLNFFREIENKTKVINDIVFQTKLLSFNASVEAARAGDQGKGFAVVAQEVGNLAAMSGNAAKEINELLSKGVDRSEEILDQAIKRAQASVDAITAEVHSSRDQVNECLQAFEGIAESVNQSVRRLDEIARANNEQKMGVERANETIQAVAGNATQISHEAITQSQSTRSAIEQLLEGFSSQLNSVVAIVQGESDARGAEVIEFESFRRKRKAA